MEEATETPEIEAVDQVGEAENFVEQEINRAISEMDLPDNADDFSGEGTLDDLNAEAAEKTGDLPTEQNEVVETPEIVEPDAEAEPQGTEAIRSLREANKQKAAQLKELQAKIAEYETQTSETVEKKPPSQIDVIAEKYSTEDILSYLGRYQAGQVDLSKDEADKLKVTALQALERKSSGEILDVLRKAQRGQYGEVSEEIRVEAAEALAAANASSEVRKQEQAATNQWQQERNASLASVLSIEGMADESGKSFNVESEVGKNYLSAGEELAQSIPGLAQLPHAPEIVHTYMNMKEKSLAYESEMPALKKENEELRARLKRFGGTLPTGTTGKGSQKPLTPEQELARELKAQGFLT